MLFVLSSTGCSSIMHELQPHRLWRLNYQEPAGRTDGVYFSVDDTLSEPSVSSDVIDLNACNMGASDEAGLDHAHQ